MAAQLLYTFDKPETLEEHIEDFEFHCDSKGNITEEQKRGMFMESLDKPTKRSLKDWLAPTLTPRTATYSQIVAKLREKIQPSVNKFVGWKNFQQRKQHDGETATAFHAELMRLAAPCGFEGLEAKLVLYQFVNGLRNQAIQQSLLARHADLTLSEALRVVSASEESIQSSKAVRGLEVEEVHRAEGRRPRGGKREPTSRLICYRCGDEDSHTAKKCPKPWRTFKCTKCGKSQHLAKACRQRTPGKFGIYSMQRKAWVVLPSCGRSDHEKCYYNGALYDFAEVKNGEVDFVADVLVSENSYLMNDDRLYAATEDLDIDSFECPKILLHKGVPGCGKTTTVIRRLQLPDRATSTLGDLVLFSTKSARSDFVERLKRDRRVPSNFDTIARTHYRTVHSFLINHLDNHTRFHRLLVDEALMCHGGEILMAAAYARVNEVELMGDTRQIPYINRMPQIDQKYQSLVRLSVIKDYNISYRITNSAAALISVLYSGGVRTTNPVRGEMNVVYGTIEELKRVLATKPDGESFAVLTFKQSEMTKLKSEGIPNVYTIHTFQGQQAQHIFVFRSSPVAEPLYDSNEHILVAITRHTKTFTYVTCTTTDAITGRVSRVRALRHEDYAKYLCAERIKSGYSAPTKVFGGEISNWYHSRGVSDLVSLSPFPDLCTGRLIADVQELTEYYSDYSGLVPNKNFGAYDLQVFIDEVFPGHSVVPTEFDSYDVNTTFDLNLHVSDVVFDVARLRDMQTRKFDRLRPTLRTGMPTPRPYSPVEKLLALIKRNDAVPEIKGFVDQERLASDMASNFVRTFVDREKISLFESFSQMKIVVNSYEIGLWINESDKVITDRDIFPDCFSLHEKQLNSYMFTIKTSPKPEEHGNPDARSPERTISRVRDGSEYAVSCSSNQPRQHRDQRGQRSRHE